MCAYQTTTDKKHCDGNVFEIFKAPFSAPVAQMFEEDVGRTVDEDESTLDEFGGWYPSFARRSRTNVPCLRYEN